MGNDCHSNRDGRDDTRDVRTSKLTVPTRVVQRFARATSAITRQATFAHAAFRKFSGALIRIDTVASYFYRTKYFTTQVYDRELRRL